MTEDKAQVSLRLFKVVILYRRDGVDGDVEGFLEGYSVGDIISGLYGLDHLRQFVKGGDIIRSLTVSEHPL